MDNKYNGSSVIYGNKNFWFYNVSFCYVLLWPGSCSKLSCFKRPWSCLVLKNLLPFNVRERAGNLDDGGILFAAGYLILKQRIRRKKEREAQKRKKMLVREIYKQRNESEIYHNLVPQTAIRDRELYFK